MNTHTDAIRKHHSALAKTLHDHARAAGEPQSEREAFVAFLKHDVLPHAEGEERHLYPIADQLVRSHGRPTATMMVDHEFIRNYIAKIEETAGELARASGQQLELLQRRLQDLALRLDAIFELHLAKEERVYLPLFEQHVAEAEQTNVLKAIHETYEGESKSSEDRPLDVREVVPRQRHTLIFDTFGALKPGQAFVLVNDHDPRPLYYQFQAEHTGEFSWDYLEQGPEVWRVRIGRSA
jgi:uncharacterized protein (DUF2249 family)/iron-sulfur cluster repair protein YtfE (RIC family)